MKHTQPGILITFIIIVVGALLIGGATVALFTSSVGNTLNSFQSGTLVVQLDREPGNYYFELSDIAPGDQGGQQVTIMNSGTLDLVYQLTYTLNGVLAEGDHPLEISFLDSNADLIDLALERTLNQGQQETLVISWMLPLEAGNQYQAGTAQFDLLVNATQLTGQTNLGSSNYNFRDLSISDFQTSGPWTNTDGGFHTPITHGNLESLLFIPNNRDSYTLTLNAVLGQGVYRTGTSGGFGLIFEASLSESGQDSGYILQFDRFYREIHIRRRTNGQESRQLLTISHLDNALIPDDVNDPWWTMAHQIEIQVTPSESNPGLKSVNIRVNGVELINGFHVEGTNATETFAGLRSWYSTATFQTLMIH